MRTPVASRRWHLGAAACLANLVAIAPFAIPVLHPSGTLRYLLPSPLVCSVLLVLAFGASAGLLRARFPDYLAGAAFSGLGLIAWAVVVGWVLTNLKGTPGVGPSFGRYLVLSLSSVASLGEFLVLFLIVPTLAVVGWSSGKLLRIAIAHAALLVRRQRSVA